MAEGQGLRDAPLWHGDDIEEESPRFLDRYSHTSRALLGFIRFTGICAIGIGAATGLLYSNHAKVESEWDKYQVALGYEKSLCTEQDPEEIDCTLGHGLEARDKPNELEVELKRRRSKADSAYAGYKIASWGNRYGVHLFMLGLAVTGLSLMGIDYLKARGRDPKSDEYYGRLVE